MITDEASARSFVEGLGDAKAMGRLDRVVVALREENQRQNLVSRGTLEAVWTRHIADSAQLLLHCATCRGPWLDLGTGAGFPGLIIAALRPDIEVVLVESRRKRIEWLDRMRGELRLARCIVQGRRLELVPQCAANVISARAFAPLPKLIELAQRFSTSDTTWLLPKGRSAAQELAELPRKWRSLFHVEQSLTDPDARILVGKEANRT